MSRKRRRSRRWVWLFFLVLVWLFCSGEAQAGAVSHRLEEFPHWQGKPAVESAAGDLEYPDWMAGEWAVQTTLVDLVAPLAPEIVTPGFDRNRDYLGQPIEFRVRFGPAEPPTSRQTRSLIPTVSRRSHPQIVADRAFNGKNLAQAYLGDRAVLDVKVDPDSPNRQITFLQNRRQLISTITGRASETPDRDRFLATEVFQQVFRGTPRPYFNEVETTTAYHRLAADNSVGPTSLQPSIEADQATAIYLSPQDPDYFRAGNHPVALYRYRLEFFPANETVVIKD